MTDIVDQYNSARVMPVPEKMLKDAIDEVIRLRARIAALEAALKPFVEELEAQEIEVPHFVDGDGFIHSYGLRLRHLRAARAVLGEGSNG